jgi:hypothetical protein
MYIVVRAIVGLAYYPDIQPGEREKIPTDKKASLVIHGNITGANVLVGELLTPGDDVEHQISPLVKVG